MNIDPIELLKTAGGLATLTALGRWFIVRPLKQAEARERKVERELKWFKDRFKSDVVEKCEQRAAVEEAESGIPSMRPPPRDKMDTFAAIEADAQYQAWAMARERSREISMHESHEFKALAPPLAGLSPRRIVEVDARKPGDRPTDPAPRDYPRVPLPRRRGGP